MKITQNFVALAFLIHPIDSNHDIQWVFIYEVIFLFVGRNNQIESEKEIFSLPPSKGVFRVFPISMSASMCAMEVL